LYLDKAERLVYYAWKCHTNNSNDGRFDEAFQSVVEDGVRGIIRGAHGTSIPMGRVPGLKRKKSQGPFYASRCILARPARSFPGGYYDPHELLEGK
jgi:hypothetical protein